MFKNEEVIPLLYRDSDESIRSDEGSSSPQSFTPDLSRLSPILDEKLPPTIIVTPAVPANALDYKIAFIASHTHGKLSLGDDDDYTDSPSTFSRTYWEALKARRPSRRARTLFCLAIPVCVVVAHVVFSRIIAKRVHASDLPDGGAADGWPAPFWSSSN